MNLSASTIREQDHQLGEGDLPLAVQNSLVARCLLKWDSFHAFWSARFTEGKSNFDALVGNIFSSAEKEEFRRQDKIVLQIPELVPKINALEGMQINGRKEGVIVPVGGEDAPDTEVIGHLVKSVNTKNHLELELTASFTDAIVSGYPSVMWYEKSTADNMSREMTVYHEQWDACLLDPKFSRRDYADGEEIQRIRTMSRAQLLATYPERKQAIEDHVKEGGTFDTSTFNMEGAFTASERDTLFNQMNSHADMYGRTGLHYVIERNFFVQRKVQVWASQYSSQVEILPSTWTQQEINRWKEFHPEYHSIEKEMRILWVTTVTATGLLLENKPHWFQEGEFPCEIYVPRLWNNKVYGVVEFLKGSLKGRNVTKIEHLHSLRMSNDDLMVVKEGAIVNAADAATEKARTGGIIVRSRFSAPDDVSFPLNNREQLGWADMSLDFLGDIDRLSVDRNFEGGTQSSQESGRAIDKRVAQTQVKYSPYLSTFNLYNLRVTRKILLMIPYIFTEYQILKYMNPKTKTQEEIELNKPEYDWVGEAVARVKNNLCGAKYDYVEAEGDNSVTAKEHEMLVFNELLDRVARISEVQLWPFLLTSVPNRMAQEFGQKLQEHFDAQANAPKEEPIKLSVSIKGEDLLHNPRVIQILASKGILPPDTQSMPQAGGSPQGGMPAEAQAAATQSPEMAAY